MESRLPMRISRAGSRTALLTAHFQHISKWHLTKRGPACPKMRSSRLLSKCKSLLTVATQFSVGGRRCADEGLARRRSPHLPPLRQPATPPTRAQC
ncbi:hypothetical protein SKAU_G00124670 [Synaphobranchus kaupii]|uniref:Uncharacterized protein n=1 Tax=Synaphobranchus kaupii TaxID=118154 RepID=A0A9Q1J2D5_SYNKA|nr:hypothetical protein SKAU_G00124670 [Synaphobranchus kaupii]